jgi:hypothetical protein
MGDILSQGRDRGTGPWPRWVAVLAVVVLVLATVLIIEHRPRHQPARRGPSQAAVTVVPLPVQAVGPDGVSGLAMPRDDGLRLPVTGEQPAWLWPATGRMQPIGGLPPDSSGYQFIRVAGGWAVQADSAASAARPSCGSCAGPRLPVYFLADDSQSVTRVGTADSMAPGAAPGALWLASYPAGADMSTAAGTAQEISVAGAPAGPRLRLPAGYMIYRGTDRGLLLAPAAPSGTAAYKLWNPNAPQAESRTFDGVVSASPRQIAWATRCDPVCGVEVLDLATGQHKVVHLPGASSAVNGAFSPDGKFLSLQLSFDNVGDDGRLAMQLDVMSTASGNLTVVPAIRVSSDALVDFGWPADSDDLVAQLNFTAKTQVAAWHPGAHRLTVAAISPGPESTSLIVG